MSRSRPGVERRVVISASSPESFESWAKQRSAPRADAVAAPRSPALDWDSWIIRAILIVCASAICYTLEPFQLRGLLAAGLGVLVAAAILLAELRLRQATPSGILGGAVGAVLGMLAALLATLVISRTAQPEPTKSFLEYALLFAFAYLGLVLGSEKGGSLHLEWLSERVAESMAPSESPKLLDTSVLIDGRIAEICEAQFLDGPLVVPQFVLHELQLVADSGDALKRQRGRRGLDVLERLRKMPGLCVRILEQDSAQTGDVDNKLVELARRTGAKIVTNDFNLNKVATVQGLAVLNVNQLAHALKPAVLPGEPMRVFVLREGKEANQGVAYLDDGTMVVVDGARRLINRNVDMIVTSVHQTTAGKMIFGRLDDRTEPMTPGTRHAAVAGRTEVIGRVADGSPLDRGPRPIFPESDAD
jgi:uncharacterized protein YacL